MTRNRRDRRAGVVTGFLLLAVLGSPAAAQQQQEAPASKAPATTEVSPIAEVDAKRADLAKELASAKERLDQADVAPGVKESLTKEVDLLGRADLLLSQQRTALQQLDELASTSTDLARQLDALRMTGPTEPPPYSFTTLEGLRDQLDAEQRKRQRLDTGVQAARDALDLAKRQADDRERARRQAREDVEGNADTTKTASLAAALRNAQLESRVAAAAVRLRELELNREQSQQEAERLRIGLLQERIRWLAPQTRFTQADLQAIKVQLANTEQSLHSQLDQAQRTAQFLESQLFDARKRLDAEPGDKVLAETVEARRLAADTARQKVVELGKQLERLAAVETAWERRYQVATRHTDRHTLNDWREEAERAVAEIDITIRLVTDDQSAARAQLSAVQAKIDAGPPADATRWLDEQKRAIDDLVNLYQAVLDDLASARQVQSRLVEDIKDVTAHVSIGERLSAVWSSIKAAWSYEVGAIDDRPITLGKVIAGVLVLLVGLILARRLSAVMGRRLLARVGMPEGAAAAIQTITFYVLICVFALFALRLANVPLTAFTILGGALAIGAGFGSQTIIKNFLSGLVLLAERPIRVGDLIQVGDLYGTVEHLGARSTRVRTGDNIEIVVPNGAFLEENIVNWTLSDTKIRVSVAVGVVYGSPTRDVARLLTRAVDEHGRVLKTPTPIILFTEFGDNALQFEVHFWIRMRNLMDRRTIESDIRYRIDNLFSEAGIVIAFPQRDVHLDSVKPVEVRLVPAEATPASEPNPSERRSDEATEGQKD